MDKFNIKISKLSLESDGNITGDTFVSHPDGDLGDKLGVIFGLIELYGLPDGFLDDLIEIIADLKTEYYLPPFDTEYGVEKRFEECLSRANRRINKAINDSIERVDLRNINILIGLAYKNKIHLSQIGQAKALLYHEKKKHGLIIIDILSQAGEKKSKIDQEKMFSNLISGEITPKDDIVICNDSIFEYVSQNDLGNIISENVSSSAMKEISDALKETSGGENHNFYCLLLEPDHQEDEEEYAAATSTGPTANRQPEQRRYGSNHPQGSIERLLTTQNKTEKFLAPSMMPNWQKIIIIIGNWLLLALKKIGYYLWLLLKFIYKYLRIGLIKLRYAIGKRLKNRRNLPSAGRNKLISEAESEIELETETETVTEIKVRLEAADEDQLAAVEIDKEIRKPLPDESDKPSLDWERHDAPAFPGSSISDKINNKLNGLAAWLFRLKLWQKAILIIVFILVFLFSQSVVWLGRSEESTTQETGISALTKQIEDQVNNAEAQNIFNDENSARQSLAAAKALMAQIPSGKKYDSQRNSLQEKIDKVNQTLQKVSYLDNPKVIADLAKINGNVQAAGLARVGNTLLSFDNNNQNLYLIEEASGQATSTVLRELSQVRKIVALNGQKALILNGDNGVFIFDLAKKTLTKSYSSDSKITDMEVYSGKVYLLKAEKNQVYKHSVTTDDKLNSGSVWISGGDAANGAAIALDGGLYLGRTSGEIKHFSKNKLEDKTWVAIEPPLKNIIQLATGPQSNYIFALDGENKRIIAYNNNGALMRQYTSKSFGSVTSLALMEKEKKIYLLSNNKVYLITMDF